jgi:hypothetical protein
MSADAVDHTNPGNHANLERQVARLVAERASLFTKAGASFGLSTEDQQRLGAIEREIDQCFTARRQQRAAVDARRFDRDRPFIRRPLPRPGE